LHRRVLVARRDEELTTTIVVHLEVHYPSPMAAG
jgi:hypothetical protein